MSPPATGHIAGYFKHETKHQRNDMSWIIQLQSESRLDVLHDTMKEMRGRAGGQADRFPQIAALEAREAQLGVVIYLCAAASRSLSDRVPPLEGMAVSGRLDELERSVAALKSPQADKSGPEQAQGQPPGQTSDTFWYSAIIRCPETSTPSPPFQSLHVGRKHLVPAALPCPFRLSGDRSRGAGAPEVEAASQTAMSAPLGAMVRVRTWMASMASADVAWLETQPSSDGRRLCACWSQSVSGGRGARSCGESCATPAPPHTFGTFPWRRPAWRQCQCCSFTAAAALAAAPVFQRQCFGAGFAGPAGGGGGGSLALPERLGDSVASKGAAFFRTCHFREFCPQVPGHEGSDPLVPTPDIRQ